MPKRQRAAVQSSERSVGARWLEMASNLETFVAHVSNPTWDGDLSSVLPRASLPVKWEVVPDKAQEEFWKHEIVWCKRNDGAFAVHRFSPNQTGDTDYLAALSAAARQEMADAEGEEAEDTASNIGGFHGTRDAWWREAVQGISQHIGSAVRRAAEAEATALRRPVITASPDEAWFNVLGDGAWNCLHTHPGAAYSGVYYIEGGGGGGTASEAKVASNSADGVGGALEGRLALVYESPEELPEYHHTHLNEAAAGRRDGVGRPEVARAESAQLLLIDPIPGTSIVFPSFVPHCVLPARLSGAAAGGAAKAGTGDDAQHSGTAAGGTSTPPLRVSLAFNFGSCEPVIANVFTLPGPRVKLHLETVPIYGLMPAAAEDEEDDLM